jgi:hypothetical protein
LPPPPPPPPPQEFQGGKNQDRSGTRKKLSGGLYAATADDRGKFSGSSSNPAIKTKKVESPEELRIRKFNEAIRDAERSTLCFNLTMGNKPLMNKTTIAEKAALALTAMAAKVENRNSSVPSPEAIASMTSPAR